MNGTSVTMRRMLGVKVVLRCLRLGRRVCMSRLAMVSSTIPRNPAALHVTEATVVRQRQLEV